MDKTTIKPISLRLPHHLMSQLNSHLFSGNDNNEHGAVIGARTLKTNRGIRLLGHRLFLAKDGVDYILNERGYWTLAPSFVRKCALECAEEKLAYLAIHNHPGERSVRFSEIDKASHRYGYPALLDILNGPPVGGLVFARGAAAGDIWLSKDIQVELDHTLIVGTAQVILHPSPPSPPNSKSKYDRQVRIFGDRGQDILSNQKVGIVGAGGAGSLINEYLARLGVGHLVVVDNDRLEVTNFPRIVGSRQTDLWPRGFRVWLSRLLLKGNSEGVLKVEIAKRVALEANPNIRFEAINGDIYDDTNMKHLTDCDAIFLAADTMKARYTVNTICHQYLIPVWQVGAKVQSDEDGKIVDVFSVVRRLIPRESCLKCNDLIFSDQLALETSSQAVRDAHSYVEEIVNPSVITLNAVSASHAVNEYLFAATGLEQYNKPSMGDDLIPESRVKWVKYSPITPHPTIMNYSQLQNCQYCGGQGWRSTGV